MSRTGQRPARPGEQQLLVSAVRAASHAVAGTVDRCPDAALQGAPQRVAQYLRAVVTADSHRPSAGPPNVDGSSADGPNADGAVEAGAGPFAEALAAVSAACADLDRGDLPGAYLALRAADSALHEAGTG